MEPTVGRLGRLHVEPVGGAAGDMLLGALIDAGADLAAVRAALASLGERGLTLEVEEVDVAGERALAVRSLPSGSAPAGRHLGEILEIIDAGELTPRARTLAARIFDLLAEAEAESHAGTRDHVHLHEVGALDSIMDVVGIAVAYDSLGMPPASCGVVPSGHGTVTSAHGVLHLPAPAVRVIAARTKLPLVDVPVRGETVTPTGAAVLACICSDLGVPTPPGAMRIGSGVGTRRFADRPNVVRIHGYAR